MSAAERMAAERARYKRNRAVADGAKLAWAKARYAALLIDAEAAPNETLRRAKLICAGGLAKEIAKGR